MLCANHISCILFWENPFLARKRLLSFIQMWSNEATWPSLLIITHVWWNILPDTLKRPETDNPGWKTSDLWLEGFIVFFVFSKNLFITAEPMEWLITAQQTPSGKTLTLFAGFHLIFFFLRLFEHLFFPGTTFCPAIWWALLYGAGLMDDVGFCGRTDAYIWTHSWPRQSQLGPVNSTLTAGKTFTDIRRRSGNWLVPLWH